MIATARCSLPLKKANIGFSTPSAGVGGAAGRLQFLEQDGQRRLEVGVLQIGVEISESTLEIARAALAQIRPG